MIRCSLTIVGYLSLYVISCTSHWWKAIYFLYRYCIYYTQNVRYYCVCVF